MDLTFARTVLVIIMALSLSALLFGYAVPFDTTDAVALTKDVAFFVGYIYFTRSLLRLPFALRFAIRMARKHHRDYGDRSMTVFGFWRGFLDQSRWRGVTPLASLDRFGLIAFTMLATVPRTGAALVTVGGILGVLLMLLVYTFSGAFSLLLDDALKREGLLQTVRANKFNLNL